MAKPITWNPRLLTEDCVNDLENTLGIGCTVEVSCGVAGISRETFYKWLHDSETLQKMGDANPRAIVTLETALLLTFLTRITRARTKSLAVATAAIYTATVERRYTESTVKEFKETRLRKNEKGEEVPYLYEWTETVTEHHVIPADWRAGVEMNKRRDPEHWNPPARVEVTFEQKAITYIRSGQITFQVLAKGYGHERAIALFQAAGVAIPEEDEV